MSDQPRRGLGALLQSTTGGIPASQITAAPNTVPLSSIRANPHQPRKEFDEGPLRELAESIRSRGLIQPIVVRSLASGESTDGIRYEIIAGERRWRASQLAELVEVPVVVKGVGEATDVLVLSLIENLQREDLNPVEEATAYQRLSQYYKLTQEQIAQAVGKSRAAVANSLRILDLNEATLNYIKQGKISTGHAKVLLSVDRENLRDQLVSQILAEGLSVRALEERVAEPPAPAVASPVTRKHKPAHVRELEAKLSQHLGTKVTIQHGAKRGKIIVEFYTVDDFDRIAGKMGLKAEQ